MDATGWDEMDVPRALDGLNSTNRVASFELGVYLWELDVDDVAKGFGCVGGDAYRAC